MSKRPSIILAGLALAAAVVAPAAGQERANAERPRAVIELFTSQGCSSCPPADRLMVEMAKDPSLIILSLPVDYWDYLGWKDTLAHASFTYRQKAYSATRGDRQVYTPQAVINGALHAVGSDRAAIEKAIAVSRQQSSVLSVDLRIEKTDTGLRAVLPASPGLSGHLWLLPMVRERAVQIGRGENTGRSVTYANVVRGVTRLGFWTGEAVTMDIPASALPTECEGLVVLLQGGSDKKPGQIMGAARRMGL
jgi:hypothetical protein